MSDISSVSGSSNTTLVKDPYLDAARAFNEAAQELQVDGESWAPQIDDPHSLNEWNAAAQATQSFAQVESVINANTGIDAGTTFQNLSDAAAVAASALEYSAQGDIDAERTDLTHFFEIVENIESESSQ
jgi:hypothetical protein